MSDTLSKFSVTEYAWLQLAGLDYEASGLPLPLFRELYDDILTYGPEAPAVLDFVKTVNHQDPKMFLASMDYTMGAELQQFEAAMAHLLNGASRRPKATKLAHFVLDAMEDIEIAKYRDLWNNILSLCTNTGFSLPAHSVDAAEMKAYVQLLNMGCWTLIGDEVFPPRTEAEKFRSHLKPLTLQYLETVIHSA